MGANKVFLIKLFEAPTQKKAKKSDNYLYKMHMSVRSDNDGNFGVLDMCVCVRGEGGNFME